jgi:predicted anti-sigma-YlaC factor YlaD
VTCELWQSAISARIDGEEPGVEPRLLEAHLASCVSCRRFQTVAEATRRAARVQPAPPMPDLSRRIVKLNAIADRASRWSIVRVLLGVVAIDVIAFALRALVLGQEDDASAHAARHLGAFTFAYGVGLLVVVVRPARARTMLPVAAVLAGALGVTAVVDLSNGNVPLVGEATHLPELLSVLFIWLLAVPTPRRRREDADHRRSPALRAVPRPEDAGSDRRVDPA